MKRWNSGEPLQWESVNQTMVRSMCGRYRLIMERKKHGTQWIAFVIFTPEHDQVLALSPDLEELKKVCDMHSYTDWDREREEVLSYWNSVNERSVQVVGKPYE